MTVLVLVDVERTVEVLVAVAVAENVVRTVVVLIKFDVDVTRAVGMDMQPQTVEATLACSDLTISRPLFLVALASTSCLFVQCARSMLT